MPMLVKCKRDGKSVTVDVSYKTCPKKSCFRIGEDKGTFVQGRGYVRYHEKVRLVCFWRHLHGCPTASVCRVCHTSYPEGEICPKVDLGHSKRQQAAVPD
jgi:hypothetical protein